MSRFSARLPNSEAFRVAMALGLAVLMLACGSAASTSPSGNPSAPTSATKGPIPLAQIAAQAAEFPGASFTLCSHSGSLEDLAKTASGSAAKVFATQVAALQAAGATSTWYQYLVTTAGQCSGLLNGATPLEDLSKPSASITMARFKDEASAVAAYQKGLVSEYFAPDKFTDSKTFTVGAGSGLGANSAVKTKDDKDFIGIFESHGVVILVYEVGPGGAKAAAAMYARIK